MSRKQWKKANHAVSQRTPDHTEFGPNEWLVDELHQQYLADKNSVDPAWWEFFAETQPSETPYGQSSSSGGTSEAASDGQAPEVRTSARAASDWPAAAPAAVQGTVTENGATENTATENTASQDTATAASGQNGDPHRRAAGIRARTAGIRARTARARPRTGGVRARPRDAFGPAGGSDPGDCPGPATFRRRRRPGRRVGRVERCSACAAPPPEPRSTWTRASTVPTATSVRARPGEAADRQPHRHQQPPRPRPWRQGLVHAPDRLGARPGAQARAGMNVAYDEVDGKPAWSPRHTSASESPSTCRSPTAPAPCSCRRSSTLRR